MARCSAAPATPADDQPRGAARPVNDGELHVAVVSIVVAFCVLLRLKMTCQEVVDHLEWRRMERRVVGVVAIFGPPQPVHPPTCAADCQ
jgi:hypothetical protein